jgi:phage gpG-like protein
VKGGLIRLTFIFQNRKEVDALFNTLGAKIKDLRPIWQEVVQAMRSIVMRFFGRRQQVWKPLTPKYLEWKQKHGYSTDIGILTGRMYRALADPSSPDNLQEINELSMRYGLKMSAGFEYPRYFDKDRPLFFLEPDYSNELQNVIQNAFIKVSRAIEKA